MTRHIYKSTASGTVVAPPSKSYAHRMLICAGLSNHECKVENIQLSNDIIATLNCLKALGVDSRYDETSKTVYIKPSGKKEELFELVKVKQLMEKLVEEKKKEILDLEKSLLK
jgi:5-enolpyruvylshikimate-3-phosphate synthase